MKTITRGFAAAWLLVEGCVPGTFARSAVEKMSQSSYRIVERDEKGGPVELELTAKTELFSLALEPGTRIRVGRLGVPDVTPVGGVEELGGEFTAVKPSRPVTYRGVAIPAGSTLYFREDRRDFSSQMKVVWLGIKAAGPVTIGKLALMDGDTVTFAEGEERPVYVWFHQPRKLGERDVPADAELTFNERGDVTGMTTAEERAAAAAEQTRRDDDCRIRCAELSGDEFAFCMQRCMGY